jgi:hypothetical protein
MVVLVGNHVLIVGIDVIYYINMLQIGKLIGIFG